LTRLYNGLENLSNCARRDSLGFSHNAEQHLSDYYILYEPTNGSPHPSGIYAIVPVGSQYADGTWRELRRDLDADLWSVFGVGVEQVLRIYIWGDYDLDDLTLIGREERSCYYAGGARVAMRQSGTLYYILTDHPSG